jgi:hypothetical protein
MKRKEKGVSEMVDREGHPKAYFLLHLSTRGIRLIAGARSVAASAFVASAPPRRLPCLCRALYSAVAHGCMILQTLHSPRWIPQRRNPPFEVVLVEEWRHLPTKSAPLWDHTTAVRLPTHGAFYSRERPCDGYATATHNSNFCMESV